MPETRLRESGRPAPTTTRVKRGWCMPQTVRRFGCKLTEQQLWCWGRDIECPKENLLMRYGFERHRDTSGEERSSCYRLDRDELHVCLWGFGMFFGQRELGGLFLGRFEFCPEWAPIESLSVGLHWPDELPLFGRPKGATQWKRARELWASLLDWIADYEIWVRERAGEDYRQDCVTTWLRPHVRAEKMVAAWRFLGRQRWDHQERRLSQTLQRYTFSKESKNE